LGAGQAAQAAPRGLGGWLRALGQTALQVAKDFMQDNAPQWGAAIAYFTLLSLFPLLLTAVSLAAYFVDPLWAIDRATRLLGDFLPGSQIEIANILKETIEARGPVSLLSTAVLLWTGSRVFGAVTQALNIVYDADEPYGFLGRVIIELGMSVSIGVLFVVALASRLLLRLAWERLLFAPADASALFRLAEATVPVLMLLLAFYLIYQYVPRRRVRWPAAFVGAALAVVLFMVARPLFLGYLERFARFNLIYGSITIVIVTIVWAWVVAMILLLGGEVASHVQAMIIEGRPAAQVEHRHRLRSPEVSPEPEPPPQGAPDPAALAVVGAASAAAARPAHRAGGRLRWLVVTGAALAAMLAGLGWLWRRMSS
jgi:membrane protein